MAKTPGKAAGSGTMAKKGSLGRSAITGRYVLKPAGKSGSASLTEIRTAIRTAAASKKTK